MDITGRRVVVTGGAGFLGTHVVNKLVEHGADAQKIVVPRSSVFDLRTWENCVKVVKGADIVIHLAGKGGGIGFNQKYPGSIMYDNVVMGANLIEASRQAGVSKFVTIGTVCSYPKVLPLPFKEEDLWNGYPEPTNAPYGLSKKILLVQGQAYRAEYGFNSIHLLLVNIYGPGDDFSANRSHVIPALIRKMDTARRRGDSRIVLWGTGSPSREFLYVEDAAEAICLATEKYDGLEPVNIGSGSEIKISELVKLIAGVVKYKGEVKWDSTKPDGQPRRALDTSRALKELGFKAKVMLEQGIPRTVTWYEGNRNEIEKRA